MQRRAPAGAAGTCRVLLGLALGDLEWAPAAAAPAPHHDLATPLLRHPGQLPQQPVGVAADALGPQLRDVERAPSTLTTMGTQLA